MDVAIQCDECAARGNTTHGLLPALRVDVDDGDQPLSLAAPAQGMKYLLCYTQ